MIRRSLSNHAARLVALALVFALYGFARLPTLSQEERVALASRFAFTRTALPVPAGVAPHFSRRVHPDMQPIAGWISSVGAAVAIHDLDGNGLDDDACWVDPRYDQVLVAPLPGTGERFPLFALDPAPLPYDARTTAPMGCLPGDFNEDGLTDLLVYYWGRPPILFLRRGSAAGAGVPRRAAYQAVEIADPAERWYTNALTSADVDGDGHLDLIVGNYFQDGARILDDRATSGEEMQRSMSHAPNGGRNRLLLFAGATAGDRPSVRFTDIPDAFDHQTTYSWTLAIGAADLDGDMRPELYFANDFGNDRLLHNLSTPGHPRFAVLHGERTLATPRSKILGRDSFKGMGVDFADLNGDGRLDIYVSNIAQDYALEESHFVWVSTGETGRMREGVAPYVDRSEPLGLARSAWSWDARFVDFDDDGVPEAVQATGFVHGATNRWPELQELAMGNDNLLHVLGCWPFFRPTDDLSGRAHDPFFVRAASGRYFDVAPELGFGMNQISRGLAVADVDGDGRLDLAVANQWGDSYFYRNVSPHPGAFLG
ncbi:MAG TPA: FG-GAP and VCBS repeat-containing protein, partial [Thermoanaerobaculia bacterium]